MILGPVSYLDCLIFCILLTPQLLIHIGPIKTFQVVVQCLPFLCKCPPTPIKSVGFIRERFFISKEKQTPFVRIADPFEDLVVRCVRYAFANIPAEVGRVFFSKQVAMPFLRFRMLRHGYVKSPVHWHEYGDKRFKGIWIIKDPVKPPDICVYYAHGGGFAMGSSFFYLEYLLTWLALMGESYQNPAIFSLEYTLIPDSCFPTQLSEAIAGYNHVLTTVRDPSRICISGDSAGACIIQSLLLHLADLAFDCEKMNETGAWRLARPEMAALISPWVTLVSEKHQNTPSDYLDRESLHRYAHQYAGGKTVVNDPLISPGNCRDVSWWKKACPLGGIFFEYGAEELFAPDIQDMMKFLEKNGMEVSSMRAEGCIHAWPVANLFISTASEDRLKGLRSLVQKIKETIPPSKAK